MHENNVNTQRIQAGVNEQLGLRPLYRQVRDILAQRIATGHWPEGTLLPSEFELAADLGVSQGIVRKALKDMESEHLVIRRQGRGSYVNIHDDAHMLFLFHKLGPDARERRFPDSQILNVSVDRVPAKVGKILNVRRDEQIIRLERVRSYGEELCVLESIMLPQTLFPGLNQRELPNNLYQLYRSEYGITIVRATDKLKAVAATRRDARHLSVPVGKPLLQIERTSIDIEDRAVEWRVSRCLTDSIHYLSDLK